MANESKSETVNIILARLDTFEGRQETIRKENREDHQKFFDLLNGIMAGGCPTGKRQAEDIAELKRRPEKLIAIGAAIVAITAAIRAFFVGHP